MAQHVEQVVGDSRFCMEGDLEKRAGLVSGTQVDGTGLLPDRIIDQKLGPGEGHKARFELLSCQRVNKFSLGSGAIGDFELRQCLGRLMDLDFGRGVPRRSLSTGRLTRDQIINNIRRLRLHLQPIATHPGHD